MSNANKGVFGIDEVFERLQNSSWPIPAAGGGGGASTGTFVTRTYTGDNATVEFNVTSGLGANDVLVFENGVSQLPTTDYTVSSGVLTFTTAPETNVIIQIRELTIS